MNREPGVDVDLWFRGAIVSPETKMKDIAKLDDSIIGLRAVEKSARPVSHFQSLGNIFPKYTSYSSSTKAYCIALGCSYCSLAII